MLRVDILLLDLQMDRNSLIDIRGLSSRVKVIVRSSSGSRPDARAVKA